MYMQLVIHATHSMLIKPISTNKCLQLPYAFLDDWDDICALHLGNIDIFVLDDIIVIIIITIIITIR